jgi:Holliday junction resolvasome RuvABC endonuclease subunit
MKILSFDQSTSKTGWSIFIDEQLESYGVIRPSKKINNDNKVSMFIRICEFIKEVNPDIVLLEDVYMKYGKIFNVQTHKTLANLQGMLMGFLILEKIPYEIIHPQSWKNGIVGKKKVSKADSICICLYYMSTIKTIKK